MSRAPRCKLPIGATLAATAGVVALGLAAGSATAAGPAACDASALRLSVLGGPAITPINADGGAVPCADSDGTLLGLPLPSLSVQAVEAHTRVVTATSATATAQVTGVRIGASTEIAGLLGGATGPLLDGSSTSIVGQVDGLVSGLLGPLSSGPLAGLIGGAGLLGGIGITGVDSSALIGPLAGSLTGALTTALPDVLEAGLIEATALTACSTAGVAQAPSGSSRITNLRALGVTVDANGTAERVTTLDTARLSLGQLLTVDDVLRSIRVETNGLLGAAVQLLGGSRQTSLHALLHTTDAGVLGALNTVIAALTGGQTLGSIVSGVTTTLQPLLDATPVSLPPNLVRVQITPNQQATSAGTLTQQAVGLTVTALTRPVLAGTLAEARASTGSIACVPPADPPTEPPADPPTPPRPPADPPRQGGPGPTPTPPLDERYGSPEAAAVLSCSRAPATLIDVYGDRGRTRIHGATERRFAGRDATIVLADGSRRVGRARIDAKGLFTTTVPLPPAAIRDGNRARYYAVVDGRRTPALKFARRTQVTGISARGRQVTLSGRVVGPQGRTPQPVLVEQRTGCSRFRTVGRATPRPDGRFRVRVTVPAGVAATVYRARTRVPATARSTRLRATFSLPRVIGIGG